MDECTNTIEATGKPCGSDTDGPFDSRFCSEVCADRVNQKELAELGITPEMMKEAVDGYFECRAMIERRTEEKTRAVETESHNPYECSPEQPDQP